MYFFCIIGLVQNQKITGSTPQPCAVNSYCSDSNYEMAGIINNWIFNPTNQQCQVIDCSQLSNQNSTVSDYSCASCNTSDTPSSNFYTQGNVYANSFKDTNVSVSINCLALTNSSQMTSAHCSICAKINSTVNSDKKTCTAVISNKYTCIHFLPLLLALSVLL
ncbi:hypothetical protein ABPG72_018750 [Tetrahymena utriculariae]